LTSSPEHADGDAWRRRERDPTLEPDVEASADETGGLKMSPSTRPTITAFERSPDGGRGLARDMRVRWALEEVGRPYDVRPVSFAAMKEAAHRRLTRSGRSRPTRTER
jgi:hypothetical protein